MRKAVIHGLSRLQPEAYLGLFLQELQDEHPGVSRAAAKALGCIPYLIPKQELSAIATREQSLHVLRNTLRVLGSLNKWEQLDILLGMLETAATESVRQELLQQLDGWIAGFNRQFAAKPLSTATSLLEVRLQSTRRLLGERRADVLTWLIS
ncbi:HEAT repeat domain-containing protein [Paenibacillus donghaensis]|uniref:HEAT repeat domain-containing protein n=1 Tax=Paenibacillus donghaensis TaxID=414771 RepID=A0A2Z2K764_9BACL|nr:hypothetical protein B9T62_08350 [Paenibacillus donghaensis]